MDEPDKKSSVSLEDKKSIHSNTTEDTASIGTDKKSLTSQTSASISSYQSVEVIDHAVVETNQAVVQAEQTTVQTDQPPAQTDQPAAQADQPAAQADQLAAQADQPAAQTDQFATPTDESVAPTTEVAASTTQSAVLSLTSILSTDVSKESVVVSTEVDGTALKGSPSGEVANDDGESEISEMEKSVSITWEGEINEEEKKAAVTEEEEDFKIQTKDESVTAADIFRDDSTMKEPTQELEDNLNIFGEPRQGELGPAIMLSESTIEEEEEEEEMSDIFLGLQGRGIPEPIDREYYELELEALTEERNILRRKNAFYNRKISEHYRKRKMEKVFEETGEIFELQTKYERKIEELYEINKIWEREKSAMEMEIDDMIKIRNEENEHLQQNFESLLAREREIGMGLTDISTGKIIPEKVIHRLIHRQEAKSAEIAAVRLKYIKQRDRVREVEAKIKSLETIDGTLHLMDFEQLRMENTTYSDKIEERDEELMRLRDRHSHAVQAIAHIREKTSVIEVEIEEKKELEVHIENQVCEIRENLNALKIQRDYNRSQKNKLKLNSGLLTYPRLLSDMEGSVEIAEILKRELEGLKVAYKENRENLKAIRYTIEQTEQQIAKKPPSTASTQKRKESTVELRKKSKFPKKPFLTPPQKTVQSRRPTLKPAASTKTISVNEKVDKIVNDKYFYLFV